MITKDDIDRLKALRDTLGFSIASNPNSPFDKGDLDSLCKAIAHLDQPYQWGDEVEVQKAFSEKWWPGYKFIGMNTDDSLGEYIVKAEGCTAENVLAIRPIPQTVNVALDKSTQDLARELQDGVVGSSARRGDIIMLTVEDYERYKSVCKAIASQEGGDNE